jgi:hypothetical protein
MNKKILTSIDPSEITQSFFSRIYNIVKISIHNIITPPPPGNNDNIDTDNILPLSEPLITKKDSMELLKETYFNK